MRESVDHYNDHEFILELAELSRVEDLSASDSFRLQEHLSSCEQCREVYSSLEWFQQQSKMFPKPAYFGAIPSEDSWDHQSEKTKLIASLHQTKTAVSSTRMSAGFWAFLRPYRWAGIGAAACAMIAASGFAGYRLAQDKKTAPLAPIVAKDVSSPNPSPDSVVADLQKRLQSLEADLRDSRARSALLEQGDQQAEEQIALLHHSQEDLQARYSALQAQGLQQGQELDAVSKERESITAQLGDSQRFLEAAEHELSKIHEQGKDEVLHTASLEMQVRQYSAELKEKDKALADEEKFLASDRDIRELMGARQLYIADVMDVDDTGRDRKPFGRVFYTKGKSLIFYGFDLDQQTGIRDASVFQVWGHSNGGQEHPLDLGVFYKDDDTNRRWVLRFDDPHTLTQIDAVFVTLESRGPSKAPTGKPFLYTYLRKREPNHP